MAGGTQCTVPVEKRWALVMWVTAKSPSALGRGEEVGALHSHLPKPGSPDNQQRGTLHHSQTWPRGWGFCRA